MPAISISSAGVGAISPRFFGMMASACRCTAISKLAAPAQNLSLGARCSKRPEAERLFPLDALRRFFNGTRRRVIGPVTSVTALFRRRAMSQHLRELHDLGRG